MTEKPRSASVTTGRGRAAGSGAHVDEARTTGTAPRLHLLAVGGMTPAPPGAGGTTQADITCLPYAEVTAAALDEIRPDVVFSALVGSGFDCLDLAERLTAAGFRGQYRVVAPTVPDLDLVRREIRGRCPALDFDIVCLSDDLSGDG